eukprot:392961-Pelagomonas_calceolata.AAC.1
MDQPQADQPNSLAEVLPPCAGMDQLLSAQQCGCRIWIYFWLVETSHKPVSQMTWLKVTPPILTTIVINVTIKPSAEK